jgi:hypothetical protein
VVGPTDAARAPGKSPPRASLYPTASSDSRQQQQEKFTELRAVWARPWPDDDAADRRAFAQACAQGATPDAIIAGAHPWVGAVEPRFLPQLARWLANRGWEKPPPQRPRRSKQPRHQRHGKVNAADPFFRLGDQYAAKETVS